MTIRFDDRVAIVTGAGAGLGRSHAMLLASRGAKVVVNDPGGAVDGRGGEQSVADKVVAEIRAAGGEAVANYDSVADMKSAQNIIDTAVKAFGRLEEPDGVFADKPWVSGLTGRARLGDGTCPTFDEVRPAPHPGSALQISTDPARSNPSVRECSGTVASTVRGVLPGRLRLTQAGHEPAAAQRVPGIQDQWQGDRTECGARYRPLFRRARRSA